MTRPEIDDRQHELPSPVGASIRSEYALLLGTSRAFSDVIDAAQRAANTGVPVFITGETGTGKQRLAQFIHERSRRARRPLVMVDCAALPPSLLEAELLGPSQADDSAPGPSVDRPATVLEAAHEGTLFLDNVTELPPSLQAKLIPVVQDGVVRRADGERAQRLVDVRFISATDRDPEQAVTDGHLRSDLLYRLRVVSIRVPPLRERRDDIPTLALHFLDAAWARHHPEPARPPQPLLSAASVEFLRRQRWRGNVRELQNLMEHVAVLAEPGQVIAPEHFPGVKSTEASTERDGLWPEIVGEKYHTAKERLVTHFEHVYLCNLLDRAGGNLARAARMASVDRATLYRLIDKHRIPVSREAVPKREEDGA